MRTSGQRVEVGAVLADTVSIYRAHPGRLLGSAAVVFVVAGLLQAVLFAEGSPALIAAGSIVGLVGITLYTGLVVRLVERVRAGDTAGPGVGKLLGSAAGSLGRLLVNAVVKAVLVFIGLFLLILPGIYLLTIWAVTAPAIVVERRGPLAAFDRSGDLVRPRGWAVLGVIAATFLIGLLVVGTFGLAGALFGDAGRVVAGTLGSIAAAPIWALVASILYFQLREVEGE